MTAASRNRPGPDADRLLVARLSAIARRHARWGAMDETHRAAGVAEVREVAGGRYDLLAEVGGITPGTAEGKGSEYEAQAQAVAKLCRLAGADESLIPQWIGEGQRRAQASRLPVSQPGRTSRHAPVLPGEAWKIEIDLDSEIVRSKNNAPCRARQ
jgi:hypothetical protein